MKRSMRSRMSDVVCFRAVGWKSPHGDTRIPADTGILLDSGENASAHAKQHEIARREAGRGVTFAVLENGAFRGIVSLIGLMHTHRALTYRRAELAYWLGRPHRGRGLATEAGIAALRFGFGTLGLHKVHVGHFGVNTASRALIERLGFRPVGIQRQEFSKDGVWHDHHLYEMLDAEFAAQEKNR